MKDLKTASCLKGFQPLLTPKSTPLFVSTAMLKVPHSKTCFPECYHIFHVLVEKTLLQEEEEEDGDGCVQCNERGTTNSELEMKELQGCNFSFLTPAFSFFFLLPFVFFGFSFLLSTKTELID